MSEPALVIRRRIARPDAALVARFAGAPTGNVGDCQSRRGSLPAAIKPVTAAYRFAGPALTVQVGPKDNLAIHAATKFAQRGDVLVVASGGHVADACIGDLLAGQLRNLGIAAIVTDSAVRDIEGLDAVGLPVFAAAVISDGPWKHGPGRIGLTESIGGVTIAPGDILVGDRDGVVVVPQAEAAAVADRLDAIKAREAEMERKIAGGLTSAGWLDETLDKVGVLYLDD